MMKERMKNILAARKTINSFDEVAIQKCWDEELSLMTASLEKTLDFLNEASEEELFWNCEVWEELSSYWHSPELIAAMKAACLRFPSIAGHLEIDIHAAEEALNNA